MIDRINELSEINSRLVKQNDKLKKELKQLNQWHVVADGDLPKEETTVLVKLNNGEVITGGVLNNEWYLGTMNIMWLYFDCTDFVEDDVAIVEWKEI